MSLLFARFSPRSRGERTEEKEKMSDGAVQASDLSLPGKQASLNPAPIALLLLASAGFCAYRLAPILIERPSLSAAQSSAQPTQAEWELAMLELDEHQTDKAVQYIGKSLGIEGLQAHRAVLQGRLFLEARKLFAARSTLREAQNNSSLAPIASYWLGATNFALGDVRSAEAYWLDTLQALPRDPNTHRSLAMIYYDRGAIDHAVHHLKELTTAAPDDARPYRLLGLIHKDYERYGEAAAYYRTALELGLAAQTREQVRRELAECLIKTRDYQAGLEVLSEAVATYDALVLKAECLIGLGQSDEAAAVLDEVLAGDPKHADALVARAGIYMEQQQHDRAVELLRRAVAVKPVDYLASFRLSQALRSQGEREEAASVAAQAEEIKRKRERFSKLHQEATAKPLDAEVRFELGQLATELKMPEMAITWYKAALDLDPKHEQASEKLAELSK